MLKHDLTMALRRLRRQKFQTAVGVAVLTLGLLCFVAANLLVSYVRNYDTHWSNSDRMYIVAERVRANDFALMPSFMTSSDAPVAEHLRADVPELGGVARRSVGQRLVSAGDRRMPLLTAYVEPQFGEIFDFDVLAGDARAIANPRSALITQRGAERLFGTVDAVGRTITIAAQQPVDVTIGGVVADLPNQSHLKFGGLFATGFDLLVSWDALEPLPVMG
jgi:putative ABC transport system permease protein